MFRYLFFFMLFFIAIKTNGQTPKDSVSVQYGIAVDENLFISVYYKDYPRALLFIKNGAKVNKLDENGMTPLQYAIVNKDFPMVNLLLSNGADVNVMIRATVSGP